MFTSGVMDAPRTIHCDSVWDALVLRHMLEEQGVQVRRPDEGAVLSMVASGALAAIKAAVAQLSHEFPGSGPVVIEGGDGAESAVAEGGDGGGRPGCPGSGPGGWRGRGGRGVGRGRGRGWRWAGRGRGRGWR